MMLLRLLILAVLLVLAPTLRVSAQVNPDDARRTLEVLQDPQKRDQLVTTLQTIAQARQPATPPPAASPIAPDSLGAEVLIGASGFLNHLSGEAIAAFRAIRSVPQLWGWLKVMATDPWARGILLDTAWRLALVLAVGDRGRMGGAPCGAAADPGAGRARRPTASAPAEEDARGARRARRNRAAAPPPDRGADPAAAHTAGACAASRSNCCRCSAFLTVGHLIAATALGGVDPPRLVLLAVIDAYALCAAILCVARIMLSPGAAAPAPADRSRARGRLRHALDPAHRGGQRVRLRDRRGRAAARPVRRRARGAAEGGRPASTTSSSASSSCSSAARCGAGLRAPRRRNRRGRRAAQLAGARLALDRAAAAGDALARLGGARCRTATRACCATSPRVLVVLVAGAARPDRHPRRAGPGAVAAARCGVALSRPRGAPRALPSGAGQHRPRADLRRRRDRRCCSSGASARSTGWWPATLGHRLLSACS